MNIYSYFRDLVKHGYIKEAYNIGPEKILSQK